MRRDLRFKDNHALFEALEADEPVVPLFIFDRDILDELPEDDARVTFIYERLEDLRDKIDGQVFEFIYDEPLKAWEQVIEKYEVKKVFANHDYEPYADERDEQVRDLLEGHDIVFETFKDQVIFEKLEVAKDDGTAYRVFTPYKKVWLAKYKKEGEQHFLSENRLSHILEGQPKFKLPTLKKMGFSGFKYEDMPTKVVNKRTLQNYEDKRDFPAEEGTTRIGLHLRFGTVSIRDLVAKAMDESEVYLSELIWREFYAMILANFPHVVSEAFKAKYDNVPWRNDEEGFEKWCKGETGYPMVDAGMRQLNQTGYMHNRVRMVVASFLTKHLLIDWRWGEAYFAEKLLDYELASNNGGWQWAAGTGTDAQPYFRVFNPESQFNKFDPDEHYVKKWVPEYGTDDYVEPMVEHKSARQRAIDTYKEALDKADG
ncbi:deoxyribodipyrimidine photo-lyase [Persicobacter psychrovividus]|uniref:Deoxyribodipyrimidine photo-lyase n=2 Tax=Persicobacter psychrovividus TaxID=387638 RepID=A0ABN6L977_9BACT|nr:deoxyribodipyrimidine photo-lyase [Persicobacter psychrovividus]